MNFPNKLENKKFATENTEGTERACSHCAILFFSVISVPSVAN